jgi:hypothetical protein
VQFGAGRVGLAGFVQRDGKLVERLCLAVDVAGFLGECDCTPEVGDGLLVVAVANADPAEHA